MIMPSLKRPFTVNASGRGSIYFESLGLFSIAVLEVAAVARRGAADAVRGVGVMLAAWKSLEI